MSEGTRTCKKCGETKPLTAFNFRKESNTYRWDCKDCRKANQKAYYEQNKDIFAKKSKEWRKVNYEYWQQSRAKYYQNNKEVFNKRNKKWVSKNRHKVNEWARQRRKQPYYKLREAHRSLLRRTIDGKKYDLGYTREELKEHIEKLFSEGMSWDNYGEWEIDHIKPVKAFWDEGVTDPKIVSALQNLQPLWARDNRKKSSKWVDDRA